MVKGLQESSKYEYRVEMVNHANPHLCVVREFASDFESGECWGYNKFFKIDILEDEGYLSKDDSVILRFFVRPPTYFQKCRDQQHYIAHLENSRSQALLQIEELHSRYGKLEQKVSVFSSYDNPLETLEEESKYENLVDEKTEGWAKYDSDQSETEEFSLKKQLKRLAKLKREEQKYNEDEISREESANPANALSTVLQKYMMSPEEVSSHDSDTPRQLKWTDEVCSELLTDEFLDSPERQVWYMSDGQMTPDALG